MGRGAEREQQFEVERVAPDTGLAEEDRRARLYARRRKLSLIADLYGEGCDLASAPLSEAIDDSDVHEAISEGVPEDAVQEMLLAALLGYAYRDRARGHTAARIAGALRRAKQTAGLELPFSPYVMSSPREDMVHLVAKPGSRTTLCGVTLDVRWQRCREPRGYFADSGWGCESCFDKACYRPLGDPLRQAAEETDEDAGLSDEEAVAVLTLSLKQLREEALGVHSGSVRRWLQQVESSRDERLFAQAAFVAATELLALDEEGRRRAVLLRWKDEQIADEASLGELATHVRRLQTNPTAWPEVEELATMIVAAADKAREPSAARCSFAGQVAARCWPEAARAFRSRSRQSPTAPPSQALLDALATAT